MSDSENDAFMAICGSLLIAAIVLGYSIGLYKAGRWFERRDLTKYFVRMTQETYQDGFDDGKIKGYMLGKKAGLVVCDDFLNHPEDGRY